MENATKALLIAGELLIGVIILSIFAYTFRHIFEFTESYYERQERQKIIQFNSQYTKYITQETNGVEDIYIYAEDVVTITEQAISWNKTTADDSEKITVTILDKSGRLIYSTAREEFKREDFLRTYKLTGDPSNNNKEYKFSCTVNLNDTTGRVKEVVMRIQGVRE